MRQTAFGKAFMPTCRARPCATRYHYVRNNHGETIETAFFGTDGQPIKQKHGYARIIDRYDDYGALVERAYFGVNGEPVLGGGTFARISIMPDKLGRQVEWAYFGVRGEPVIWTRGCPLPPAQTNPGRKRQRAGSGNIRNGRRAA